MAEWVQAVPVVLLGVGLVLGVVDLVWWAVLAGRRHADWEATARARAQVQAQARETAAMAPYAAMFAGLDQQVGALQAAVGVADVAALADAALAKAPDAAVAADVAMETVAAGAAAAETAAAGSRWDWLEVD